MGCGPRAHAVLERGGQGAAGWTRGPVATFTLSSALCEASVPCETRHLSPSRVRHDRETGLLHLRDPRAGAPPPRLQVELEAGALESVTPACACAYRCAHPPACTHSRVCLHTHPPATHLHVCPHPRSRVSHRYLHLHTRCAPTYLHVLTPAYISAYTRVSTCTRHHTCTRMCLLPCTSLLPHTPPCMHADTAPGHTHRQEALTPARPQRQAAMVRALQGRSAQVPPDERSEHQPPRGPSLLATSPPASCPGVALGLPGL